MGGVVNQPQLKSRLALVDDDDPQAPPTFKSSSQARGAPAETDATSSQAKQPMPVKQKPLLRRVSRDQWLSAVLAVASITLLFAVWYLGTKYRIEFYIRFKNVPTPYEVFRQALEMGASTKFVTNIINSVRRILAGFAIAILIGVPLGLVIGRYRHVRSFFMPVVEILRPIPAIAWVPMSIMLWPSNEASIVYITFIGAFFPILLNTIHGVHSLDGVLIRAGRCLGASEPRLFLYVILPGALPHIFTGLAVGMGVAWVSLIAAEMISGQFGVGYFTWEAYSLVDYPAIVLGMITIGVLGLACSGLIRLIGKLLMPWLAFAPGSRK
ncbi:ABC transporter permease [Afipia sp. P52-10]|nr:ABC transporter permease [Afipia sp. P52-10]